MAYDTANERGPWASGTAYALYDVVEYEGYKYECINASGSTGNDPAGDTANTYWLIIGAEGTTPDPTGHGVVTVNEATYQAAVGDFILAATNTTITVPAPTPGGFFDVASIGASITATVSGAVINGGVSTTVTTQYTRKHFVSDGLAWFAF